MAQGLGSRSTSEDLVVSGCEIAAPLGRGGMGAVYLARQVSLDREVAVKVLAGELADDPLFLERLEREARLMARLRHPNIVAVHDFQKLEDGSAAIVMEFIEGGSLRDKLRQHPKGLPVDEALRILRQIAAGLEVAHAAGVIHRDMKPENVLLTSDGMARVTDFGLALPLHESSARLTLTGTAVGTVDYMAPEQLKGGLLDVRLDVFALGVIAYELFTGQTPRGSFDPPNRVRPEVPLHISEAVMRAMKPDPDERFAKIEDFILALHRPSRTGFRFPRAGIIGAIAMLLVLGLGAVGTLWILNSQKKTISEQFGPWRDAIAGARIYDDVVGGDWKNDKGILSSNDQICAIILEHELPESYDVRMKFTRLSGEFSVALFFMANGTTGSVELDAWAEALAGVQMIDDEDLKKGYGFRFPLENGRSYELLLEVRPNLARVSVDGVFQKEFDLAGKKLSITSPWEWDSRARRAALGVGSYMSPTRFERVEWRSVTLVQPSSK